MLWTKQKYFTLPPSSQQTWEKWVNESWCKCKACFFVQWLKQCDTDEEDEEDKNGEEDEDKEDEEEKNEFSWRRWRRKLQ